MASLVETPTEMLSKVYLHDGQEEGNIMPQRHRKLSVEDNLLGIVTSQRERFRLRVQQLETVILQCFFLIYFFYRKK